VGHRTFLLAEENFEIVLCSNGQSSTIPALKAEVAIPVEPENRDVWFRGNL
jgi:hypothetical protein